MADDVILDGTNLKGFTRLVAHHEECADPIVFPTLGCSATDVGTRLAMPGSIWDTIHAKVDPSVMPAPRSPLEVLVRRGSPLRNVICLFSEVGREDCPAPQGLGFAVMSGLGRGKRWFTS